jgi:hypothetical protein
MKGSDAIFRGTSRVDKDREASGHRPAGTAVSLPVEWTTMEILLLWAWVIGATPLTMALIQWAAERLRDAVRAGMSARRPGDDAAQADDVCGATMFAIF